MEQQALLLRTVDILNALKIPYMMTGSFAVNFYGIPRTTHDIDVIVLITPADAARLAKQFPADFYADVETMRQAIQQEGMFNVIDPASGLKIDFWMLTRNVFDLERFRRRRAQKIFGRTIWMPMPEDVILSKLSWYRQAQTDKHLNDARGVWQVQQEALDQKYLRAWAIELGVQTWLEKIESED